MKKLLFAISLMLTLVVFSAYSQAETKVRFGGAVGFNMTKWGGDYSDFLKTKLKPGFHIGAVAEMMIFSGTFSSPISK